MAMATHALSMPNERTMLVGESGDDMSAEVLELRRRCLDGAFHALNEARENERAKGKPETTAIYLRLCCEYIKYDLYHMHNKLEGGRDNPKSMHRKNAEAWWDEGFGIGEYARNTQRMQFGWVATVGNLAAHPQIDEKMDKTGLEGSIRNTIQLVIWWMENHVVSSQYSEMGFDEDWLRNLTTRWELEEDESEELDGDSLVGGDLEDEGEEPEEGAENDEPGLLGQVVRAITINGGERNWVNLSGVIDTLKIVRPEFSVRKEGYHNAAQMMLSDKFANKVICSRGENSIVIVKIRGDNDPLPPGSYAGSPPRVIIRDAIRIEEDRHRWVLMGNLWQLNRLVKEIYPDFRVSDYGYRSMRDLVRNLGAHNFEIRDSMIRTSPCSALKRFLDVQIKKRSVPMGEWVRHKDLKKWIIEDGEESLMDSRNWDSPNWMFVARKYPLFFETEGSSLRVRNFKREFKSVIEEIFDEHADSDGWMAMTWVGHHLTGKGRSPSDYGFGHLGLFLEEMLGESLLSSGSLKPPLSQNTRVGLEPAKSPPVDYTAMTVPELRGIARDMSIRGYSKLRKADLIDLIEANEEE